MSGLCDGKQGMDWDTVGGDAQEMWEAERSVTPGWGPLRRGNGNRMDSHGLTPGVDGKEVSMPVPSFSTLSNKPSLVVVVVVTRCD